MKKIISIVFLLFCFSSLSAQSIELLGQLLDQNSGEPVPYASIRLSHTGYGTISNAEGEFSLSLSSVQPTDFLEISCIGYADLRLPISDFVDGEKKKILLQDQPFTLDEVFIYPVELDARQLVYLAFKHIKDNYATEEYILKTFYRHYCKEQGVYGRLIEGAIDLYDEKGYRKKRKHPGKKFGVRMNQLRRSIDFTSLSGFRHAPISLFATLQKDVVAYQRYSSILLADDPTLEFSFQDTTYYQGKVVYVVRCTPQNKRRAGYFYDLYISADDFVMLRADEQLTGSFYSEKRQVIRVERYVTTYQSYQGRYYLSHVLNEGKRTDQRFDSLGQVVHRSDHYHHVELMVNEIQTSNVRAFEGGEPSQAKMAEMPYDPSFWKNYTVLKATPLEEEIRHDLAQRVSLEEQFRQYNEQDKLVEIQDQLMITKLDNLLRRYQGQPVLLCFWDSGYKPGLKELLFARKLAKEYSDVDLSMGLIFLSLDKSEAEWNATIRKYRLFAGQHIRLAKGLQSALAQRYRVRSSPHFVLLDSAGKVIIEGSELPKRSQIDDLMQELVR